jgi:hyperosmotically inducible periplasmic protein
MNTRHGMSIAGGMIVSAGLILGAGLSSTSAQTSGVAETIGQKLDDVGRGIGREARAVGESMRKTFDTMKTEVSRMNTPARVYARLHWDRSLHSAKIEVHPVRGGGVLLRGTVPDQAARERAVALARDTFEVTEVIDELSPLITTTVPTPVIGHPTANADAKTKR